MSQPDPQDDLRSRLDRALRQALKSRDMIAVSAVRSALSAIANAEATPVAAPQATSGGPHFAGSAAGLGAGEAPRLHLSSAQMDEIVRAEISERQAAAQEYEQADHADRAARLRREAQVLSAAVLDDNQPGA
jgi:uncharacterized protein YqeY